MKKTSRFKEGQENKSEETAFIYSLYSFIHLFSLQNVSEHHA